MDLKENTIANNAAELTRRLKLDRILTKKNMLAFIFAFFRYVLLIGLGFIILFPFISKITTSFMPLIDTQDPTVVFIPRNPSLVNYIRILTETDILKGAMMSFLTSILYAVFTTASCSVVAYGLSKFKLKISGLITALIVFTILVPPQTVIVSIVKYFKYFNMGVGFYLPFLNLGTGDITNTPWPLIILGITGFGFRAGLYTLIMRQFFNGVPDQLIEAAYVDGSGVTKTFLRIIMPLSVPVLMTVFLFSFCWQWTDIFYSRVLFEEAPTIATSVFALWDQITVGQGIINTHNTIIVNTASLIAIAPLIVLFLFCQKAFVQGIERSGIVG
ncbi:MAG: carbohydrate ABC transporter permease [Oscillospiraceae bacterium]|nr:carbohydrate ABC transporter permease [Oscillospiraceae bacterium]